MIDEEVFQSTLPLLGETELRFPGFIFVNIFQSTLPLQGETAAIMRKAWQKAFQSTLPLQRETLGAWSHSATARHFNPLPPRRGRR